jgi:hypothetical protein
MAPSDAAGFVVVGSKIEASGVGDIDSDEWDSGINELGTDLRRYIEVDLRIDHEIDSLRYKPLRILQRDTGAEPVIHNNEVEICGAGRA